jgi:hypothetical protein
MEKDAMDSDLDLGIEKSAGSKKKLISLIALTAL